MVSYKNLLALPSEFNVFRQNRKLLHFFTGRSALAAKQAGLSFEFGFFCTFVRRSAVTVQRTVSQPDTLNATRRGVNSELIRTRNLPAAYCAGVVICRTIRRAVIRATFTIEPRTWNPCRLSLLLRQPN
jgi:hypothetical protein